MIGLTRLKRAIADVPTGGMQTGDPKVPLKLCDAQRIEAEFNAIIAERDAALAQNAELVAQVEALKDWRRLALQFDGQRMIAMSFLKGITEGNYNQKEIRAFLAEAPKSGTEHLRDIQAEADRAGYEIGFGDGWEASQDGAMISPDTYAQEAAEDYAERTRRGEK